jgi:hypothetical protein
MSHFLNGKRIAFILVALTLIAGFATGIALHGTSKAAGITSKSQFCNQLGKTMQASSGAQMWCFGPQLNGNGGSNSANKLNSFSSNVDAANPKEDVTPNGTQAYGQSEESTAAISQYVVEQWNDATGFFSPACSPGFKDQLSGWGFSSNGGKSFVDEGGLPNSFCASSSWSGDPSVEVWNDNGTIYFYQSSLFSTSATVETCGAFSLCVAVTACKVAGTSISCNATPVVLADTPGGFNLEDKDFMSIDPVHGVLYVDFTDFTGPTGDDITLWECNIASDPGLLNTTSCHGPLYVAGATTDGGCELEGAYPAADLATGDVYMAYEANWATNFEVSSCFSVPVQNRVNRIPASCTQPAATFPSNPGCTGEDTYTMASVNITSLDAAFVPGYNRFPMNDFPRIAVSDTFGTVSIVWNDGRYHAVGDILLQSFKLGASFPTAIQSVPVRINKAVGGWHILPALRNVDDDGDLNISFYQRATANTALTDVYAAIDVSPLTTSTPASNVRVTTGSSDWNAVSSDIIPNFGDYTDNYVVATASAPYTQQTLYVAWADGRLGEPQPFNAHAHTN